jgi:hypothetical protein
VERRCFGHPILVALPPARIKGRNGGSGEDDMAMVMSLLFGISTAFPLLETLNVSVI